MTTETLARELNDEFQKVYDRKLQFQELSRSSKAGWLLVAAHVQEREQALREALEKFGGHNPDCKWSQENALAGECTCGFATAKELLK